MQAMTPTERREQARKAASARWRRMGMLTATHGPGSEPLKIGGAEIECYVLEDEQRVVGWLSASRIMGHARRTFSDMLQPDKEAPQLPSFAQQTWLAPHLSHQVKAVLRSPIEFKVADEPTHGYPVTILVDLCSAALEARDAGDTGPDQSETVRRAELLLRGFARVGIIGLVDEATGYKRDQAALALAKLLEAFIAVELSLWASTFPAALYEEMFRLRGLTFPESTIDRPKVFGALANDLIQNRLPPPVVAELGKLKPKGEGNLSGDKFEAMRRANPGYPALLQHLGAVVALMKISTTWGGFMDCLDEHYPRYAEPEVAAYDPAQDDGDGI